MESISTIITHSVLFLAGIAWGWGMAAMMKANKRRKRIFPRPCHNPAMSPTSGGGPKGRGWTSFKR